MKIQIILLLTFLLASCNAEMKVKQLPETAGGSTTGGSTAGGAAGGGGGGAVLPDAPTALSRVTPSAATGINTTPVINVDGVESGDTVKVYSDSTCDTEVGSETSSGTDVDVTLSPLSVAAFTLYATTERSGETSECSTANVTYTVAACPTNYSVVLGNSNFGTSDFCVARFEMKDVGGVPASAPGLIPWQAIAPTDAISECQSIPGGGYDLISNAQWQTMAQDLELNAVNWDGGVVGTNNMFVGNTSSGGSVLSVSDEANYYDQTGATTGSQKRVMILSSGDLVWDASGNAFEWTKDPNATDYGDGTGISISQLTEFTNPTLGTLSSGTNLTARHHFGPSGNYIALNAGLMGGLGHLASGFTAGGDYVIRGSGANSWNNSGQGVFDAQYKVFGVAMGGVGFRCVYIP